MRIGRAWDRFWFAPADPTSIVLLRVGLGVVYLLLHVTLLANWERYFAADGMLSLNDPALQVRPQEWWSLVTWTQDFVPGRAYLFVGLLTSTALIVGFHSQLAAVVLFVVHTSVLHHNLVLANGEDIILRMTLFFACFAPLDMAVAVRPLRPTAPRELWALRLVQVGIAAFYLATQLHKLSMEQMWWDGDVLYYITATANWGRFPWPEFFEQAWATKSASWGSLMLELAFPFLVWIPALRRWLVLAMIGLHVTIMLTIYGATFFNLAAIVTLFAFVTSDDLGRPSLRPDHPG